MSDLQNRAQDLRVVVYGEPSVSTITPKSGENVGLCQERSGRNGREDI